MTTALILAIATLVTSIGTAFGLIFHHKLSTPPSAPVLPQGRTIP